MKGDPGALGEMLTSEGWLECAKPALEERLASARRQLECASPEDGASIAGLQAQIRLLRHLTETPMKFLKVE